MIRLTSIRIIAIVIVLKRRFFTILAVSCSPPDLNVPGKEHLLYRCPDLYTLGSKCTMSCSGGYPFAGANEIQCSYDKNKNQIWQWDSTALKPFCKGIRFLSSEKNCDVNIKFLYTSVSRDISEKAY